MTHEELIQQASKARQAFNNDIVQSALSDMKALIAARMWQQAAVEGGGRPSERLCALAWAVETFEGYFAILMDGGEIAADELEREAESKERADKALKRMRDYGQTT